MTEDTAKRLHDAPVVHDCHCGKWGSFGYEQQRGVTEWRCLDHRIHDYQSRSVGQRN